MTIDEPLLRKMDDAAVQMNLARSAFIRQAVERLLDDIEEAEWDEQHRAGYQRDPVAADEFPPSDTRHWTDL